MFFLDLCDCRTRPLKRAPNKRPRTSSFVLTPLPSLTKGEADLSHLIPKGGTNRIVGGAAVQGRIASLGLKDTVTTPASPWQHAYVERLIGSIRRELLDHVVVLNERHLTRLLCCYFDYYHQWRTHRSLDMDAPHGRAVQSVDSCKIIEFPAVQGLPHYYLPQAA